LHISTEIKALLGYVGSGEQVTTALELLDEPARAVVSEDAERCRRGESVPLRAIALRRRIGSVLPALLVQERVDLVNGPATIWLFALGLEFPQEGLDAEGLVRAQREIRLMKAALEAVPVGFVLLTDDLVTALRNRLYEDYCGFPPGLLDRLQSMDDQARFQLERGDAARWLDAAHFTADQIAATPSLGTILRCQEVRGPNGPITEEEILARIAWSRLAYGPTPRADGMHWSVPFEFIRGDSGQAIEARSNPVPGIGWVQVLTDVTARRRAEQELRAANMKLEATIAELRTVQAQLVLQEKMATLGQLTAGIAHEIKNPLNFINNFAGLTGDLVAELREQMKLQSSSEASELFTLIEKNLKIISQHGQRMDSIVRAMLLHSRSGSTEFEQVDLVSLLHDACNLAVHGARTKHPSMPLNLSRYIPEYPVIVWLAPQDIMRVVLNVLSNAFYAVAKRATDGAATGYRPQVAISLSELSSGIEIIVRDNGIGMNDDVLEKLFTPFFTTKSTGDGTGLGLSLSYDVVVHGHGGDLVVNSKEMNYTEIKISLPRQIQMLSDTGPLPHSDRPS
jgi:signal transduction histidine kinase